MSLPLPSIPTFRVQFTMSQFSDHLVPSLYDANSIDTLPNLTSDDLSFSQQSFTADTDYIQFRPPALPPPIPPSLQCVGPDRKKAYVLYDDMTRHEFVKWWLKTEFGQKKRIRWETKRSSSIWQNFEQVAQALDGKAKIMCKRCGGILDHPHNNEHGTSTMTRHLKGTQCRNTAASGAKQQGIKSMIRDAVSPIIQIIIALLISVLNSLNKLFQL